VSLGDCFRKLGQFARANTESQQALDILRQRGDGRRVAACLNSLGFGYHQLGQFERAVATFQEALAIFEGEKLAREAGLVLVNMAGSRLALKQVETATTEARDALVKLAGTGRARDMALAHDVMGECFEAAGLSSKALESFQLAREIFRAHGGARDQANLARELARTHIALGQYGLALEQLSESAKFMRRIPVRGLTETERAKFLAQWAQVPVLASRCVERSSSLAERGFLIIDELRAHTLMEALQERATGSFDPRWVAESEKSLASMEALRLEIDRLSERDDQTTRIADLKGELEAQWDKWEDQERNLRSRDPKLGELFSPKPCTLAMAQDKILGSREVALVIYVLGEPNSFAWVISHDRVVVVQLEREATISAAFDSFDRALRGSQDYTAPAYALHDLLIRPLGLPKSETDLIIVPDGCLGFLPFEALMDSGDAGKGEGRARFLLERRVVRYAPSASFLVWCAMHPLATEGWSKDLLLVGDPNYSIEQKGAFQDARRGSLGLDRWKRLENTRQEVIGIAKQLVQEHEASVSYQLDHLERNAELSSSRFDLLLGQSATCARIRRDLHAYRIVHFAVHGFCDPETVWFSSLVLASDENHDSSGYLTLAEISHLRLNADIVFLSACDTARGQVIKGDGVKNVARAFLVAGARSVVATQWDVDDEAAATLASAFYEELLTRGATPAQALQRAKIALIERRVTRRGAAPLNESNLSRWAHPSFWAPFVLWGAP